MSANCEFVPPGELARTDKKLTFSHSLFARFGIQQGRPITYRTFLRIFGYEVDGTIHKDVLEAHARESGGGFGNKSKETQKLPAGNNALPCSHHVRLLQSTFCLGGLETYP